MKTNAVSFVILISICEFLDVSKKCDQFYGNATDDCLKNVWSDAGCGPRGRKAPSNLNTSQLNKRKSMNLR